MKRVKTYRVSVVYCDWSDRSEHCHAEGRYYFVYDGMKAGPYCRVHARKMAGLLKKEGYRKETR